MFWGFQKIEYFDYFEIVDIILVSSQNWTIFGGNFYTLQALCLKVKVHNWNSFFFFFFFFFFGGGGWGVRGRGC